MSVKTRNIESPPLLAFITILPISLIFFSAQLFCKCKVHSVFIETINCHPVIFVIYVILHTSRVDRGEPVCNSRIFFIFLGKRILTGNYYLFTLFESGFQYLANFRGNFCVTPQNALMSADLLTKTNYDITTHKNLNSPN